MESEGVNDAKKKMTADNRLSWRLPKLVARGLLGVLVAAYVGVALCNFSVVQSYLGVWASDYFTKEWGGRVSIGSVHVNPIGHVVLRNLELVNPENDTIFEVGYLGTWFSSFPIKDNGVKLNRVTLRNTYYHLGYSRETGKINLDYIVRYFRHETDTTSHGGGAFVVDVKELVLADVHYKQDLKGHSYDRYDNGVNIQHMDYRHVRGKFKNVRVAASDVNCRIVRLSAEEQSGFRLDDLSCDVEIRQDHIKVDNMELSTPHTHLLCDAVLLYDGFPSMSDYCRNVVHSATFKSGTVLGFADAAYWAPVLWGMDERVTLEGVFYGPVADIHAKNVKVAFGEESQLLLDADVKGLPTIKNTVMDVHVSRLHTTYSDLANVRHPAGYAMKMEDLVRRLNAIDASVSVCGGFKDCVAQVSLQSDVGQVDVDASIKYNEAANDYQYKGTVSSPGFRLLTLLQNDYVAQSGFSFSFDGMGTSLQQAQIVVDGKLDHIALVPLGLVGMVNPERMHNVIQSATVSASMEKGDVQASVLVADTLLHLDMDAAVNLRQEKTAFSVDAAIEQCLLSQLLKGRKGDNDVVFSTHLRGNLSGTNIEQMSGNLALTNSRLHIGNRYTSLMNVLLNVREFNGFKDISLNSDVLDLTLRGYVGYSHFPLLARYMCEKYVPAYYTKNLFETADVDYLPITDDDFNFSLNVRRSEGLLKCLLPDLYIAEGTSIHGNYNYTESLKMVVRSDSIAYGSFALHNLGLNTGLNGESYQVSLTSDDVGFGSVRAFNDLQVNLFAKSSLSRCELKWDDGKEEIEDMGQLMFWVASDSVENLLTIPQGDFYVSGKQWSVVCDEGVRFSDDMLDLSEFFVSDGDQKMELNAAIAKGSTGVARIDFRDFSVNRLSQLFLQSSGFVLEGVMNGSVVAEMSAENDLQFHNAVFTALVDSCRLNNEMLGKVDMSASWSKQSDLVEAQVSTLQLRSDNRVQSLSAVGTLSLEGGTTMGNAIAAKVTFEDFALETISPLVRSFSSRLSGRLQGDIVVGGTTKYPKVRGVARVDQGTLLVDKTSVDYSFNDSITFNDGLIYLRGFRIKDPRNNTLTIDGTINYSMLDKMRFDLNAYTDNIMLLNAKERDNDFYGTLFASLNGTVTGTTDDVKINLSARTNAGSTVVVPVNRSKQVETQKYIVFLQPHALSDYHAAKSSEADDLAPENNRFSVDLDLAVTPDVLLSIPMDFSQVGVTLKGSGNGNIRVLFNRGGQPSVVGNYELEKGSVYLNLLSLTSRTFIIDEGSELIFPGSVNDTRFNVNAAYSQRVSLATLQGVPLSEGNQARVAVENVISLSGTLQNPTVKFDLRLPNADQSLVDDVFAVIDRSNEQEMLNQTISLLVLGQFYNDGSATTSSNTSWSDNALASGYSIAANTLGNSVSRWVNFVDVNFDYRAATDLTTEQYDVDIRKEWSKLYFETSLGYGGESRELQQTTNSSYLVGDVLLGYKLNPKLHLFVFNRSNTNDYTRMEMPYKQGVGLKYTHEFDSWFDFFRKKKKIGEKK